MRSHVEPRCLNLNLARTGAPAAAPAACSDVPTSLLAPTFLFFLQVHATDTGIQDDSVLADDFRFEFPIIKLSRVRL